VEFLFDFGNLALISKRLSGGSSINQQVTKIAPMAQPRARGEARLSSKLVAGRSCLDGLRQSGASKILFPSGRPHLEAILINTAGGVTGGDRFRLEAEAGPGSRLTMTTQAAERAYRAQPGEIGRVSTRLSVGAGARLDWLPQELILFQGAAMERRLDIELAEDASLLMVEPIIFGRRAMGEKLSSAEFRDRIEVRRHGRPLYLDGVRLSGDLTRALSSDVTAGGAGAVASLLYVAQDAGSHLGALRAMLPPTGGASLLAPDVLALRCLAPDSFELRRALLPILDRLTGHTLPTSWRL
jgi:urease accessory protein